MWNSHVHREFPGKFESANLSREIGRTATPPWTHAGVQGRDTRRRGFEVSRREGNPAGISAAHYEHMARAKMTLVFREAMLCVVEPRRFVASNYSINMLHGFPAIYSYCTLSGKAEWVLSSLVRSLGVYFRPAVRVCVCVCIYIYIYICLFVVYR